MGRPRKQVDEEKLFTLASLGLTTAEIASVLECSPDTLERNYKEEMAEGKEKCKASVRRKQFELAMAGNPTMLIWLGKQILGQSDKLAHTGADGGPIPIANLTASDLSDEQLAALIKGNK
jgi:hypothetical protein